MKRTLFSCYAILVSVILLAACGQPDERGNPAAATAQNNPDALSDEEIAKLEKEVAVLEQQKAKLSAQAEETNSQNSVFANVKVMTGSAYASKDKFSNMLADEELPELSNNGKPESPKGSDTTPTPPTTNPDNGKSTDPMTPSTPGSGKTCSEKCDKASIIKEIIKAFKDKDCTKIKELIKELKKEIDAKIGDCDKKIKEKKEKIHKAKACRDGDKGKGTDSGKGTDAGMTNDSSQNSGKSGSGKG